MNFATLQGLTIPEGVVTQITDASGRVLWAVRSGTMAVLQVAKQTLNTYAGETEYEGENFVAIDVYPKTNGTVKVTYGGLTKTVKDTSGVAEPNAQTVYFGTLYGVADSVSTPTSGELVIEGQFYMFGCGVYKEKGKYDVASSAYCDCITSVSEFGDITVIPPRAFYNCTNLELTSLPSGLTSVGEYAFYFCEGIALSSLPSGITSIEPYTFYACNGLISFVAPEGIEHIGNNAFAYCKNLASLTLPSTLKTLGKNVAFYTTGVAHTVRILATTPPTFTVTDGTTITDFNFIQVEGTGKGKIVVPKGCGATYKAAYGWSLYADCITEAS